MSGLDAVKAGDRWEVRIIAGPSVGLPCANFTTKRDALAWIDSHGHLPWDNAHPTIESALDAYETVGAGPLLVTVPTAVLATERHVRREAERVADERADRLGDVCVELSKLKQAVVAGSPEATDLAIADDPTLSADMRGALAEMIAQHRRSHDGADQ